MRACSDTTTLLNTSRLHSTALGRSWNILMIPPTIAGQPSFKLSGIAPGASSSNAQSATMLNFLSWTLGSFVSADLINPNQLSKKVRAMPGRKFSIK